MRDGRACHPLVMVLAEVVLNALQHAYPEGGGGEKVLADIERSARELTVRGYRTDSPAAPAPASRSSGYWSTPN